jgi:hypothetical protein
MLEEFAAVALSEAEEKKEKEKHEFEDAISEAKKALGELVAQGKPPAPRPGKEPCVPRVRAHAQAMAGTKRKPVTNYAAVSFTLRGEAETIKQVFENAKGALPRAKRDVAADRAGGRGQQHFVFKAGNATMSFRYAPYLPKGVYGVSVYVRAQSPQKAKSYLSTLLSGLPGWAKVAYHEGLQKTKHEDFVRFAAQDSPPPDDRAWLADFIGGGEEPSGGKRVSAEDASECCHDAMEHLQLAFPPEQLDAARSPVKTYADILAVFAKAREAKDHPHKNDSPLPEAQRPPAASA